MSMYDEQLRRLAAQVAEAHRLERLLTELSCQRDELAVKVAELDKKRIKEQRDVDRFEGGSLASFFYNVIGRADEKLDQERQEAYEAAVRYDAALRQLQSVEYDLSAAQEAMRPLYGSDARYEAALSAKASAIKAAGGADARRLTELQNKCASAAAVCREADEAIAAGDRAMEMVREVLDNLQSADSWGTFDIFSDGIIADLMKHGKLDEAQDGIERLQVQLRRFKTELADVSVYADIHVNVDGFMRFADYFFDGLFTDFMVLDRIQKARGQVETVQRQLQDAMSRLRTVRSRAERDGQAASKALDDLILKARL